LFATTASALDTSFQSVRHPPVGSGHEDLPTKRVGITASADASSPGRRHAKTRVWNPRSSRSAREESMNSSTPPGWGRTKLEMSSTLGVAAAPPPRHERGAEPTFRAEVPVGILC
jgi:hypothetical protein